MNNEYEINYSCWMDKEGTWGLDGDFDTEEEAIEFCKENNYYSVEKQYYDGNERVKTEEVFINPDYFEDDDYDNDEYLDDDEYVDDEEEGTESEPWYKGIDDEGDADFVVDEEVFEDNDDYVNEKLNYVISRKIRIIKMEDPIDNKRYAGKEGIIKSIETDGFGDTQYWGTWGNVAVYPDYDKIEFIDNESLEEGLFDAEEENVNYGHKAWVLNEIISSMNNEGAYYESGWLYIWPDGETEEECDDDFGDYDSFKDLEDEFISIYKYHDDEDEESNYHDDGLYNPTREAVEIAHEYDKKLGLEPIQVLGKVREGVEKNLNEAPDRYGLETDDEIEWAYQASVDDADKQRRHAYDDRENLKNKYILKVDLSDESQGSICYINKNYWNENPIAYDWENFVTDERNLKNVNDLMTFDTEAEALEFRDNTEYEIFADEVGAEEIESIYYPIQIKDLYKNESLNEDENTATTTEENSNQDYNISIELNTDDDDYDISYSAGEIDYLSAVKINLEKDNSKGYIMISYNANFKFEHDWHGGYAMATRWDPPESPDLDVRLQPLKLEDIVIYPEDNLDSDGELPDNIAFYLKSIEPKLRELIFEKSEDIYKIVDKYIDDNWEEFYDRLEENDNQEPDYDDEPPYYD